MTPLNLIYGTLAPASDLLTLTWLCYRRLTTRGGPVLATALETVLAPLMALTYAWIRLARILIP